MNGDAKENIDDFFYSKNLYQFSRGYFEMASHNTINIY